MDYPTPTRHNDIHVRFIACERLGIDCKCDSMIRFDQGPQVSAQAGYSSEDDLSAMNSRMS